MAEKVASLYVDIGADTSKLESGLNRTKTGLNDAAKQASGMGAALKTALTNAAVIAGVNALVSGIKYMVAQAMEAETVMRATEATIKATGGAAGYTAEQIADLAGAESRLTSIDDEVIQSGLNMLLTFKQIGGETLPRATRAMEDMAVAMANGDTSAIDLQGTAIQLGKALNDPIAGVTALRRVGVTLSEQQQQQIKDFMAVNDIASAQAIILGELESEFGGMAEAMGGTSAGKIEKAKNALNNLAAAIGDDLTPVIANAAQAFADLLTAHERVQSALEEHEKEVKQTAGSYEEYQREIYRMVAASTGLTDVNKFVNLSLDVQAEKVARLAPDLEIMTQAEWDAANAAAEMSDHVGASAISLGNAADAAGIAASAANNYGQAVNTSISTIDGVTQSFQAMTKELIFNAAAQNMTADEALKLGIQMGLVDASTLGYMAAMDELDAKLAAGDITMIEYRNSVAALGLSLDAVAHPYDIMVNFTYDPAAFAEMYAEIGRVQQAASGIGISAGGGNQPIARAIGGSVKAGYPVKWQEVGGEVMVPEKDGTVLSHGDLMRMINALSAGGGNARGNQTVNFYGYQQPEQIAGRLSLLEAFGV